MKFHRYLCLLLFASLQQPSFACRPVAGYRYHIPTPAERYAAAELVFSGKVVAFKPGTQIAALADDPDARYTSMFTVEVAKWVKGTGGKSIEVFDTSGTDCDFLTGALHLTGVGQRATVYVARNARNDRYYVTYLETFCKEGTPAQGFPLGFCANTLKQPSQQGSLTMAAGSKTITGPRPVIDIYKWDFIFRADLSKGSSIGGHALPPGTIANLIGPLGPDSFSLPRPLSLGPIRLSGCVRLTSGGASVISRDPRFTLYDPANVLHDPNWCPSGRVTVYGTEVTTVSFALPDLHPVYLSLAHDAFFQGHYLSGEIWFWPDNGRLKEAHSARDQVIHGVLMKKGDTLWGDEDGSYGFTVTKSVRIKGVYVAASEGIVTRFWPNGNPKEFVSGRNQILGKARTHVEQGCIVSLTREGEVANRCRGRELTRGGRFK